MPYPFLPRRRDMLKAAGVAAASAVVPAMVCAQSTMRLVVSFAPGGDSDRFARLVADKLGRRLGRPIIVESKPGAGGMVAARAVGSAAADGNTLLLTSSTLSNQSLRPEVNFDLRRDLAPVIMTHAGPYILYVNAQSPARTMGEFVELLKKNPGGMAYGSYGVGSQVHIGTELFLLRTGTRMIHVAYKSNAECLMGVLKGEVQLSMNPYVSMAPFVRDGKLRPLIATSADDFVNPRVQGMAKFGIPDYDIRFWFGVHAPARTPEPVLDGLNAELNAVLREADVIGFIADQAGSTPVGGSRADFAAWVRRDVSQLAEMLRVTNISLN